MDVLLSDEFKSRVEDELAELADKRRNENDKRLKEEHDAQMQQQGAKDAHKEEPDAQTQTPHKPHLVDKACTEEGSKKGQGKGKAKTTWQGDTQQGVGPGWVDTSGGDEGWTGWGGTKGGGSKGKGRKETTSPWADDWWQDWGTNQDREYPREAQQGMARSQWGNGNDIMQNRKRMRTWDGHNNGWKGSGKGTNGCDWMPIDPRLIEEGTRAQV